MVKDYGTADSEMLDRFPQVRVQREKQTEKIYFEDGGEEWFIEVPAGQLG